ncbi:YgbB family [Gilliamella apicola SCGC AB-598-B02]|nr:YgbB family [Gilliamella apicola SCGC AB-598-B02]
MDWAAFGGAIAGGLITAIASHCISKKTIKANLEKTEKEIKANLEKTEKEIKAKFDIEVNFAFKMNWYNLAMKSVSNLILELKILNNNAIKTITLVNIDYQRSIRYIQLYICELKILFLDNDKIKKYLEDVSSRSTELLDHIQSMQENKNIDISTIHSVIIKLTESMEPLSEELKNTIKNKLNNIITQSP